MIVFDPIITELHKEYCERLPLDICKKADCQFIGWAKNVRLSVFDFSRVIALVQKNDDLFNLTKCHIDLDWDNMKPIVELLIVRGYMTLLKRNKFRVQGLPVPNSLKPPRGTIVLHDPSESYHQFPCSPSSRELRVKRILNDFPHVRSMTVGLFGDDDLVSLEIATRTPFDTVVFEIDEAVIRVIESTSSQYGLDIRVIRRDFRLRTDEQPLCDTFIVDPPYTYAGLVTFLYHGLRTCFCQDRIYLILNQMILGRIGYARFMKALMRVGIYPTEIHQAFNDYPLPSNYRETKNLYQWFNKFYELDISRMSSSCSSLFVLKSDGLIRDRVKKLFVDKIDIYDRYGDYSQ